MIWRLVHKGECYIQNEKYRKFTNEEIRLADSTSLYELAKRFSYELEDKGKVWHCKKTGGLQLFKNSNKYYNFQTGERGGAIDFYMKETGYSFQNAVEELLSNSNYIGANVNSSNNNTEYKKEEIKQKELILPEKNDNYKRVYAYLIKTRGIDQKILSKCMNEKKIYQDVKGNCVFIGYDENNEPKYCSKRGTNDSKPYKRDESGSDKSYPFVMQGNSDTLIVCESPIDVLSHATLTKMYNKDINAWKNDTRISLGCTSDKALERYLKDNKNINKIIFALDNDYLAKDKDGNYRNWGQLSAEKYVRKYKGLGYKTIIHKPMLNDFNEDLKVVRDGFNYNELESIRILNLKNEFESTSYSYLEIER